MNTSVSQGAPSNVIARPARLYHIDWLRVLAMFSVFFFHNARFFDFEDWHVKNAVTGLGPTILVGFFVQWMMPLFFVLSGAAVYYSLRFRTAGGFIKERSLRILIPFIIVGIFVLAPPQVYLERLTHGEFSGTFFQFYPHYFEGHYGFGGNFVWFGMHLWYLMDLFVFSLIALPLFLPRGKTSESLISRLAPLFEKPWALLLLFVPLAAVASLADAIGLGITRALGGWDMLSYLLFFIYGYLIFSNTRILETIKRYAMVALIVGLVSATFVLVWQFSSLSIQHSALEYAGIWVLRALSSWCWIMAILGFGSRFLNFNNRFLGYATEAVLPFYILHQPVILIIGFYIVQWSMGIAPKYFIISTTSFVAIMAIYELFVRRINILRFLFGMRLKKKPKVA